MAKIGGVEIKDFKFLRDQIMLHFGTIAAFSKVTKLPYRKTLSTFRHMNVDKNYFERMEASFHKHVNRGVVPFRISDNERNQIRICILSNFDNYTQFSETHPDFDVVYVSNVTNKKNGLKLKSKKYEELVALLNKKYKLKMK
jgi:hypothetical protein